jgi:hypothetical protein
MGPRLALRWDDLFHLAEPTYPSRSTSVFWGFAFPVVSSQDADNIDGDLISLGLFQLRVHPTTVAPRSGPSAPGVGFYPWRRSES